MNLTPISNLELFEELFNYIKQNDSTLNETLKEYGGTNYYIPSYKTVVRNTEIITDYKNNYGIKGLAKMLSRKYSLSEPQIFLITKGVRESGELNKS